MLSLVESFPKQLKDALIIGSEYKFKHNPIDIEHVILSGLGGSGIGGTIIQNFGNLEFSVPFAVNKDYGLPKYANSKTLVIISSYSGNTEETIASMKIAIEKGCTVVCITSGGEVQQIAEQHNLDCIIVPGGMPPRSCLGYSIVQQLFILHHYHIIGGDFRNQISEIADDLIKNHHQIVDQAKNLAKFLYDKTPVIYAEAVWEGLATRFRQQINENSKMLCWHHVIPEMNHNELVGWVGNHDDKAVVFINTPALFSRNALRKQLSEAIVLEHTQNIYQLNGTGNNYWEILFNLMHVTDFASVFLAEMNKVDAVEVSVIHKMKDCLAKEN